MSATKKTSRKRQPRVIDRKNPPDELTAPEVAKLKKVCPNTVYGWLRSGVLGHYNLPAADPESKKTLPRIPWSEFIKFEKAYFKAAKSK